MGALMPLLLACASQVSPLTMQAVVTRESRANPYAININGPYRLRFQPTSYAAAAVVIERLSAMGLNFDFGLAQTNSETVRRYKIPLADALEPCANLRVGARVLTECYARSASPDPQARLHQALSCYNTGSLRRGIANGYVSAVYRAAAAISNRGKGASQ